MPIIFWDASALAKRYTVEAGQEVVDAIFDQVAILDMAVTPWGYAETFSIILRRFNGGVLSRGAFIDAVSSLEQEVLDGLGFRILSITDDMVFSSLAVMRAHNLNATDAAMLSAYLAAQDVLAPRSCLLIASDQRLLRAATAEGLPCLNPETTAIEDLPALLAPL